jgi:tRNA U34 2-thiouridine synthase MnmA/TrmU
MKQIRALGLISGGLDSTLAACLLQRQGIDVVGVNFHTGFCITDTRRRIRRKKDAGKTLRNEALRAGSDLGFPLEVVDVSEEYIRIVTNPRWGYGKNANPCVDCRIMMLRRAKEMMPDFDADFVFTGEVLGQRPMTQYRTTLRQIEKQSGLEGFLLRPLSAKKLPETEVERRGWVNRERLKDFSGRSRKPQLLLAEEFGIVDFPQPAGGCCYLTDPAFGRKFFDFLRHLPPERPVRLEDFILLKVGRHLRLDDKLKIILGRDEAENDFLEHYTRGRWALRAVEVVGPLGLAEGDLSDAELERGARVLARYSDGRELPSVRVLCEKNGFSREFTVQPMSPDEAEKYILS